MIPATVLIDGVAYAVVRTPADPGPGADANEDGSFEARTQRIEIRENLPADYERETLLHEVVHGCWERGGLAVPGRPVSAYEEEVVSALSYRLIEVLRSNPALVAYLVAK